MSYIFVICYSYSEVKEIAKKKSGWVPKWEEGTAWDNTRDRSAVPGQAGKIPARAELGRPTRPPLHGSMSVMAIYRQLTKRTGVDAAYARV
jgi:hypothetical protein